MSKFVDFDFPPVHYAIDGDCNCPYSSDDRTGKCKYCQGKNPKNKEKKK